MSDLGEYFKELNRVGLNAHVVREGIRELVTVRRPRYDLRWRYYHNPLFPASPLAGDSKRPYSQGQEYGLPKRLTGFMPGDGARDTNVERKELVIMNEIGWRADTKVEYRVGKPIVLSSAAPGADARRDEITSVLRGCFAANGGMLWLQYMVLYSLVFGFADWLVLPAEEGFSPDDVRLPPFGRTLAGEKIPELVGFADMGDEPASGRDDEVQSAKRKALRALGASIRLELVEPSRALPILDPSDFRRIVGYCEVYDGPALPADRDSWLAAFGRAIFWRGVAAPKRSCMVDVYGASEWQRYKDGVLVASGPNPLGTIPIVHIADGIHPFVYEGAGVVEPLIALQDELNTRLSDRGNRLAMQAFKMYLAKGLEQTGDFRVGPSRAWFTENTSASVEEFGGDPGAPSEAQHLVDLFEAFDKISKVSPVASGAIRNRIGHLTSALALRMTLMSLLSDTVMGRAVVQQGLQRSCELILRYLDRGGQFPTKPEERRIEVAWPSPLPENLAEKLDEAVVKKELGVPLDIVLRELGYAAPKAQGVPDVSPTDSTRSRSGPARTEPPAPIAPGPSASNPAT